MTDILHRIHAYKRDEIVAAKRGRPHASLENEVRDAATPRGFLTAIECRIGAGEYALIAEIKKASPSKGLIRADFDPADLARSYESGGATCLSVLTDTPLFQDVPEHLGLARSAGSLPVLRKDFMIDPYQVLQARAWGADCILVILAMVEDAMARELEDAALSYGMDVLIEVHNEEELDRAAGLRSRLIGINNRDLVSFETTLATSERLAPIIPPGRIIVGESGITGPADLARLARVGIMAFLVRESLMRQADVAAATSALLAPTLAIPQSPLAAKDMPEPVRLR